MAKHTLVCVKEYIIPEQVLGDLEIKAITTGENLGVIPNSSITIPARTIQVGQTVSFSNKKDAQGLINTGNWEYLK